MNDDFKYTLPRDSKRLKFLSHIARRVLDKRVKNVFTLNKQPVSAIDKETIRTEWGDVSFYLYYPLVKKSLYPTILYLHGGGFIIGNPLDDELLCRALANRLGAIIVAVDYSLAPEARFPTQLEQCYAALEWVYEHAVGLSVNKNLIAIAGHSAGGNLTVTTTLLALRRKKIKIIYNVVLCPLLDIATDPTLKMDSDEPLKNIPTNIAKYFNICYLKEDDDATDPLISPIYATPKELKKMPPSIIFVAGSDSLWLEGAEFAEKLREAKVPTLYHRWDFCDHSFILNYHNQEGQKAWRMIGETLTKRFEQN